MEVIGTFMNRYDCLLNIKQGFPLFSTFIEANHIVKCSENETIGNDAYQEQTFRKMAQDPQIAEKIFGSIAPSIYGH